MPVNPQFLAARAREMHHRLLTHLGLAEPLELPLRNGRGVIRLHLRPLTERARLELVLAGNSFFSGRWPLFGDVFLFLWRMHPDFRRPLPGRARLVAHLERKRFRFLRLWYALGSFRAAATHRALSSIARRVNLTSADKAISAWIALALQDVQRPDDGKCQPSPAAPDVCGLDALVDSFARRYHLTPDQVLDLPVSLTAQLHRHHLLCQPDGEIDVSAPSDELFSVS